MPIRLNLLAELHDAKKLRRNDPVNRATRLVCILVALLFVWGGYLQFRSFMERHEVKRYESTWQSIEKEYDAVTRNMDLTVDSVMKRAALISLATNRFLWGPTLNALQYSLVDDVQFSRLRTEQAYTFAEAVAPVTNAVGIVIRGKPASSREKAILTIEAKDLSPRAGDQIFKFQEKLSSQPYFTNNLQKVELTGRSQPQADLANPGRAYVQFTLECKYPEKTH